jgi:hypothetical protein
MNLRVILLAHAEIIALKRRFPQQSATFGAEERQCRRLKSLENWPPVFPDRNRRRIIFCGPAMLNSSLRRG